MELVITIIVTIAVIGIILAFLFMRPRKKLNYGVDRDFRHDEDEPMSRPVDGPRPMRFKNGGDTGLVSLLMIALRVVIGLAAVGVLIYIFTSTQGALENITADAQITRIYSGGIFNAVITIGIAVALYIFTKFQK
jgi:hypothetical protein